MIKTSTTVATSLSYPINTLKLLSTTDYSTALILDIGSNAWRARLCLFTKEETIVLKKIRVPQSLGVDTFTTGKISKQSIAALAKKINEIKEDFVFTPAPHLVLAVATSAIRDAKNRQEVITQLKKATGVAVTIIDGLQEASIVHASVNDWLLKNQRSLFNSTRLLIDIGGGSIEIVVAKGNKVLHRDSFLLGTRRLKEMAKEASSFRNAIIESPPFVAFKKSLETLQEKHSIKLVIATGGNPSALSSLSPKKGVIPYKALNKIREKLEKLGDSTAIEKAFPQFDKNRLAVLLPAAIVLEVVSGITRANEIEVPDECGLAHGLIDQLHTKVKAHLTTVGKRKDFSIVTSSDSAFTSTDQYYESLCQGIAASLPSTTPMPAIKKIFDMQLEARLSFLKVPSTEKDLVKKDAVRWWKKLTT